MKRKRIVVFLLLVYLLTICSALFAYEESHHDCVGEDCPVCAVLHVASGLSKYVLLLFVALLFLFFALRFGRDTIRRVVSFVRQTPVTQKTKLSA